MMRNNEYPGEEGHVARIANGENPPRSKEFKMIQRAANGQAWLAFQMLQKSTKFPVKADRSRPDPKAT
eukprot:5949081-Pyramimonas_sp.AAC.1